MVQVGLTPVTNDVDICSNAAAGPNAITVTGCTVDASAAAARGFPLPEPTRRDFGMQPTGAASAPVPIRVTNVGHGADTRIHAPPVGGRHPGDFTVGGAREIRTTLAKAASCKLDAGQPARPGPGSVAGSRPSPAPAA